MVLLGTVEPGATDVFRRESDHFDTLDAVVRRWTEHRGRSLWEWAAGSSLRTALAWGIYLCLGACLGLVWGLLGGERFGGAVVGAGLGMYIGHTLRRPIGGEADPAELQRSAMIRAAVNRGEAPSDPSLAEETIALARMRQDPPGLRNAWLFFAGTDAVLFAMAGAGPGPDPWATRP